MAMGAALTTASAEGAVADMTSAASVVAAVATR